MIDRHRIIEEQMMLPDEDDVAVTQHVPQDRLIVHEGAAGAVQILEHDINAFDRHARVIAGNRGVVDDDRVIGGAYDREWRAHGVVGQHPPFELKDQLRHQERKTYKECAAGSRRHLARKWLAMDNMHAPAVASARPARVGLFDS
jgi:hypothetical protein